MVGSSLGGTVALLAAARSPELVRGVVLVAPAVPRAGRLPVDPTFAGFLLPYAVPRLAAREPARRAGQPPETRVRSLLDLCYAPGRRESDAAFAEMVDVARERDPADARDAWVAASRSLFVELARRRRFHREADAITAPVLVVEDAGGFVAAVTGWIGQRGL
ncbi:MAG: alpha/beta hydrolase [Actinobacteria bacterium]|nr:alpha/beta hydrolase [Actinomycetota bacterium]